MHWKEQLLTKTNVLQNYHYIIVLQTANFTVYHAVSV